MDRRAGPPGPHHTGSVRSPQRMWIKQWR